MGSIWGRQDPGGPHVGPMNCIIWDVSVHKPWRRSMSLFSSQVQDVVIELRAVENRLYIAIQCDFKGIAEGHQIPIPSCLCQSDTSIICSNVV